MSNKRYFWIKLPTEFFSTLEQKKMRKEPQGLLYQVVYIKMLLLSCNNAGLIEYQGVFDDIAQEIAEEINESPEDVRQALKYFDTNNLAESTHQGVTVLQAPGLIGSETQSAERVRRYRENKKALQCNGDVTRVKRACNIEGEVEKEVEKEVEVEGEVEQPSCNAPALVSYGMHNRVKMTPQERGALVDKYGEQLTAEYIAKADRTGENRGRDIDKPALFIANMIEQDYTPQEIEQARKKKKNRDKLDALEQFYLTG